MLGRILDNAACTCGLLGMKAEAVDAFRRSADAGYHNSGWCTQDPT